MGAQNSTFLIRVLIPIVFLMARCGRIKWMIILPYNPIEQGMMKRWLYDFLNEKVILPKYLNPVVLSFKFIR
jgi:hypothetical protein